MMIRSEGSKAAWLQALQARLRIGPIQRPVAKASLFLVCAATVIFLPYAIPVTPVAGLSYIVQFNNTACVVLFVLCSLAYALLTYTPAQPHALTDTPLTRKHLYLALAWIGLSAMAQCLSHKFGAGPGPESYYAVNRLGLLAQGEHPFRDFEYSYGFLQLLVPALLQRLLRFPILFSFYSWWLLQWVLGTALLWWTIRHLPFRIRWRAPLFWAYLLFQCQLLPREGASYTPLRACCSAAAAIWIARTYDSPHRRWIWATAALGTLLCLGISPEQGLAVGFGYIAWRLLQMLVDRNTAAGVVALDLLAVVLVLAMGLYFDIYHSMKFFHSGSFAIPLLLSIPVCLLLYADLLAFRAVVEVRSMGEDHRPILMLLVGMVSLPAAFGRADLGHLLFASSIFLLGFAYIQQEKGLRAAWNIGMLFFWLVPVVLGIAGVQKTYPRYLFNVHGWRRILATSRKSHIESPLMGAPPGVGGPSTPPREATPAVWAKTPRVIDPQWKNNGSIANLAASDKTGLPASYNGCPYIYRSIVILADTGSMPANQCIDAMYFFSIIAMYTDGAQQEAIKILDRRPRHPLLFTEAPLEEQLATPDTDATRLADAAGHSWFVPKAKRKPYELDLLLRYLKQSYVPDPNVVQGLRIWRPKQP
jgi:hypothetical protein